MAKSQSPVYSRQAKVILALLFFGYLLSNADRVIFGMAMKPIKAALELSDSQLGLLSGLAFGASYAIFSPLGGYVVDRVKRPVVMAGAVAFWSIATFLTAFGNTFLALFAARAGVGVGESLLHPLAVSLVGDTIPQERRPRAFGIYTSAGVVGGMLASIAGGFFMMKLAKHGPWVLPHLGPLAPWQGLFVAAAIPGVVLALIILMVMRDPKRETSAEIPEAAKSGGWAFIKRHPRFSLAVFGGVSTIQMGAYTLQSWNVMFFERVHGWPGPKAAILSAGVCGLFTLAGCLLSGRIIEAVRKKGVAEAPLVVAVMAASGMAVFAAIGLSMPSPWLALAFLPLASFWGYIPTVAGFSAMAEVVPAPIRARLAGLHTLANGIIANSLGPFLAGALSDHVFPSVHGLRWALISTMVIAAVVGSILVLQARGPYRVLLGYLRPAPKPGADVLSASEVGV